MPLKKAHAQLVSRHNVQILVVDDDSDLRLLYADALTRPGYHVVAAEDGAAAWEALQNKAFNFLIADNNMPRLATSHDWM
jgi:CheY-like chemotaxis protein